MKVIAVLLVFAATATAQDLHGKATIYNKESKKPMGIIFLSQPPGSGLMELTVNLPLQPGRYRIDVSLKRNEAELRTLPPGSPPTLAIKAVEFTVPGGNWPLLDDVNPQLTLVNQGQRTRRESIVDQVLILYNFDAKTSAATAIASGIVRRTARAIISSARDGKISGTITFHQYADKIKMDFDISNLPSGSYSIDTRKIGNRRTNGKSTSTTLAKISVKNSGSFRESLFVDKRKGMENLDKIRGIIEIYRNNPDQPSVLIASGEFK